MMTSLKFEIKKPSAYAEGDQSRYHLSFDYCQISLEYVFILLLCNGSDPLPPT